MMNIGGFVFIREVVQGCITRIATSVFPTRGEGRSSVGQAWEHGCGLLLILRLNYKEKVKIRMIRLGVISDTHFPTRLPRLPYEALENAFRQVDAIVHAGDIESEDVLHHLSEIAPVQAVRGDDDHFPLPLTRVLDFGGVRVGLTHGHFNPVIEEMLRIRRRLGYSGYREMLQRRNWLLGRFAGHDLNVMIFGHAHIPYCEEHNGILLFNPGAVYALTLDSARWQLKREKNPSRRRMLRRKIQQDTTQPIPPVPRSTVGILEIAADHTVTPHLIDLPLVDYPLVSEAYH